MAGEQTLAQRIKAKFPGEYDDIADAELETRVLTKYPGEYDDLPRSKAAAPAKREFAPPEPEGKVYANSPRDLLERGSKAVFGSASPAINKALGIAMQAAPGAGLVHGLLSDGANTGGAIGGTVGGLAGSVPGAMAGAALVGSAGGGIERWFRGQPQDATDITTDAVLQGAGEGLAPGLAHGVKKVAYPLYKAAFRPGSVLTGRFGDVTRRALDEGLPVNAASIDKAKALTSTSREAALGMVDEIDDVANPIRPSEIMPAFKEALKEAQLRERALGTTGEVDAVLKRQRKVMEGFGAQAAVPATPPTPEGPPKIMRVQSKQAPLAMSGDQALALQEFQLGHQADLAPGRVFQPTEPEVRAARQLGPSTAGVIPSRILNGPAAPPKPPVEFLSPGTPAKPGKPGKPAVRGSQTKWQTQEAKEAAGREASDILDAKAAGARISDVDALVSTGLEKYNRLALEGRHTGLKAQNKNTQELIGVLRGLEQAEKRQLGGVGSANIVPDIMAGLAGLLAAGPYGAGAGIGAGRVLRATGAADPMSRLAIKLDRTGNLGIAHGDKLTKAVRALALKLSADREAEDERVQREYDAKKKKKKESP